MGLVNRDRYRWNEEELAPSRGPLRIDLAPHRMSDYAGDDATQRQRRGMPKRTVYRASVLSESPEVAETLRAKIEERFPSQRGSALLWAEPDEFRDAKRLAEHCIRAAMDIAPTAGVIVTVHGKRVAEWQQPNFVGRDTELRGLAWYI